MCPLRSQRMREVACVVQAGELNITRAMDSFATHFGLHNLPQTHWQRV